MSPGQRPTRFDLTSMAGLTAAASALPILGISALGPLALPIVAVALYASTRPGKGAVAVCSAPSTKEAQATRKVERQPPATQQAEIALEILGKGRELGLAEIEFVLEKQAGINICAKLPKALNVDVKVTAGTATKTTIRAKYRDA